MSAYRIILIQKRNRYHTTSITSRKSQAQVIVALDNWSANFAFQKVLLCIKLHCDQCCLSSALIEHNCQAFIIISCIKCVLEPVRLSVSQIDSLSNYKHYRQLEQHPVQLDCWIV